MSSRDVCRLRVAYIITLPRGEVSPHTAPSAISPSGIKSQDVWYYRRNVQSPKVVRGEGLSQASLASEAWLEEAR
jgi:hypothetical protein